MPRTAKTEIRLRVVIEAPVSGAVYSLQDKKNQPIDAKCSTSAAPLIFDLSIHLSADNHLSGEYVRREGPTRRFIYVAVGKQAGDATSCWDRRMKIDVHTIGQSLLDDARKGAGPGSDDRRCGRRRNTSLRDGVTDSHVACGPRAGATLTTLHHRAKTEPSCVSGSWRSR